MNHRRIEALMTAIAPVIKDYVAAALAAIGGRLAALEDRLAGLPVPREFEPAEIARLVVECPEFEPALARRMPAAPAIDWDEVDRRMAEKIALAVRALPPPAPGRDADAAEIARLVEVEVGNRLPSLVDASVGRAVEALPRPADGVGVAGAVIDRDGNLVLTLSNGTTAALGKVVGDSVDRAAVAAMIVAEVGKIPPPKDGADGLGFDDIEVTYDGAREFTIKFARGEKVKAFSFDVPVIIDRGVWREGKYAAGDGVTWAGSFFFAQRDTSAKPGTSDDWRLAVKRGRDGGSAYDVARKNGFKGDEGAWLDSLRPKPVAPVKAG